MACPVCSSDNHSEIGYKDGWRWVQCDECALAYMDPLPSDKELKAFYDRYPANKKNVKNSARKVNRFKRKLWLVQHFVKSPHGDSLDIGCNTGFAVEAARQLGFRANGIDLSSEAIELARELYPDCMFDNATVEEYARRGREFDLVSCSEVIEHLNALDGFLAGLSALVKPGGALYLTTPDAGHFRVPKDFLSWPDVSPPEHVMLFRKTHIQELFDRMGFDIRLFIPMLKPSIRVIGVKRA